MKTLANSWSKYRYAFVFIIILIVYAITINANGNRFNPGHISGILSSQNTVIVGTMAIGMAMVIITGQVDLSPGSSLVLCTGVTIMAYNATGVNMADGKGKILGVFFGALSYTTINFIIVSIPALSPDIQDTFQGLVLIAVIFIQIAGPVIKEKVKSMRKRANAK